MPRKTYKPEEIVAKLRQVDVLTSQGQIQSIELNQQPLQTSCTSGGPAAVSPAFGGF